MQDKILLIAPHPFYQERGTPIAVELLIRALSERGYAIDLLTFNEGMDITYPGLTIHRVKPFPEIKNVRPGFSIKKILLDVLVFFKSIKLMFRNDYKVVHAVEESSFMALILCPLFRTPFIFDMDSSMATQILDKMAFLRPAETIIRYLESLPMRYADLVIPVCPALADEVKKYRSDGIFILKDVALAGDDKESKAIDIRQVHGIDGTIHMYIGNLESYQGIDLMLEAFAIHAPDNTSSRLVVIGGEDKDIIHYRDKCKKLSLEETVVFMGKQPVSQINAYMSQADILLSPRTQGVNTPMKVYSYLGSGVAVLATNLPTHTQVADSTIAYLSEPDPESYAAGMSALSDDEGLRRQLATNAAILIEKEHSYDAFRQNLYDIYDHIPAGKRD